MNYIGNYDYYLEKHDQMVALYVKSRRMRHDRGFCERDCLVADCDTEGRICTDPQDRECPEKGREKIGELKRNCLIDAEMCKAGSMAVNLQLGELLKQQSEHQKNYRKAA